MTQDEIICMARDAGAELYAETLCVNGKDAHDFIERFSALVAAHEREKQAEQEPVGRWNWNEAKFEWLTKFDYHKHHMTPLYAAPVRTKDLTDDEIAAFWASDGFYRTPTDFARAVIAADRKKNK